MAVARPTPRTTEPVALGPVGRELVLRLMGGEGEPAEALAGLLGDAYTALVGGDVVAARTAISAVISPALDMQQAMAALQRAMGGATDASAALAALAPTELDSDLALNAHRLAAWHEAVEASVAAQMEVIERITALQQRAVAASVAR